MDIYTIGYQGRTTEDLLSALIPLDPSTMLDVRKNAISRKSGFGGRSLLKLVDGTGIEYRHMPELGIDAEKRRGRMTEERLARLISEFESELRRVESRRLAIMEIAQFVARSENVVLLCFERDAMKCHRRCVAEAVAECARREYSVADTRVIHL